MAARPHAFVAMPFGLKPGPDGTIVDYNRVYRELLAPAIQAAGLQPFRADEEQAGGSILADMFQELLIADLVVADLSIPNPNVWYEVGVRHALRARGVVLVFGGSAPAAFDLYTERKLRYTLAGDGPDPARLKDEVTALAAMIRATMAAWPQERVSPVYQQLPQLQEPEWKTLRVGRMRRFWDQHEEWAQRLERARAAGRLGDLLVLAEEGPVAAFRAEGWIGAGTALRRSAQFALALEYLDKGLAIDPTHLGALREKGICLQRLALADAAGHSAMRARQHYETILAVHPRDVETLALLGRLEKDAWVAAWRLPGSDSARMREDAAEWDALLRAAIGSYERAFRTGPGHYFSGINALTLMALAQHLRVDVADAHAQEVMAGAVRFAAENESDPGQRFWAAATLGDLSVLRGDPSQVTAAYKTAVSLPDVDSFALQSTRAQLELLRDLGFRPDALQAAMAVLDLALARRSPSRARWQPRQVLLFSGHMMDTPDRPTPRFPAAVEAQAAQAIAEALETLQAGPEDVALCQAAAGGDLLFLEACQKRGLRCEVLLPFERPEFVTRSVLPSADGSRWRDRFHAAVSATQTTVRVMPQELGPLPDGVDPFERCNLWLLHSALAAGVERVRFVALWNGGGGDGPGGTAHMVAEVQRHTGCVLWLDTRKLFFAG